MTSHLPNFVSRKPRAVIAMYPNAAADVYGHLAGRIAGALDLVAPVLAGDELARRPDLLGQIEVLLSGWGAPRVDEAFLAQAPHLRAIFYSAGTVRGWASEAVWQRGVAITTAAAANAIPVAEYTFATILFSLKHGWRHVIQAKQLGAYAGRVPCPGAFRSRVGLVSFGAVARLVAERLRSTDVAVVAYDPYAPAEDLRSAGVQPATLDEIFSTCDVVSLHTPLVPATAGLIGRAHFAAMKSGATFINTARGEIVREEELVDVFRERPDLCAVLDVTAPEPPRPGSPLYALPNIVLTPHIAGSLGGECQRLGEAMLDELDRWLAGQPLRWQLTAEQAARSA